MVVAVGTPFRDGSVRVATGSDRRRQRRIRRRCCRAAVAHVVRGPPRGWPSRATASGSNARRRLLPETTGADFDFSEIR